MTYTGFDASDNLLTLSREEYMDDFITTLAKILENDIFKNKNEYATFKTDISNNYLNKGENERQTFIVSDGFTYNFNAVYKANETNLDKITWTVFLEKIKTNDIYKTSIETEIKSITNQFITDILNDNGEQSSKNISEYIKEPDATDTTQQYLDYIFISLLWNGGYDASCSFNTPEYVNIPQIVDTSGQYVESTPLPAVENNDDLDSMGKWEDLLTEQSTEVSNTNTNNNGGIDTDNNNYNCDNGSIQCTIAGGSKTQVTHQQQKDFINKYIQYLKDNYCPLPNKRTPQETNLSSIKRIKDKYGDVGIFYILSLIVNTISNVDSLYIPPISKDSNMENNIILVPLGEGGRGSRGGIGSITPVSFFRGISVVYNTVVTVVDVVSGGSNKSKTYKKRDKRRQNRKTMKSKNRVF